MEFLFERVPEVNFLHGHVRIDPCAFHWALLGGFGGGFHEFQLLLQFLVGEKLVAPLRQCFLDLVAQALSEFHGSDNRLKRSEREKKKERNFEKVMRMVREESECGEE